MADFKTPYSQHSNGELLSGSKDRSSWKAQGKTFALVGTSGGALGRRRQSRVGLPGRERVSFLPPSVNHKKWQACGGQNCFSPGFL